VNQRALALAESLRGQLAALGPGACSVSADASLSWLFVRIGAATDEVLRRVADDLGLAQARTARRGRVWWRRRSPGRTAWWSSRPGRTTVPERR
jgi:hypothetical protein